MWSSCLAPKMAPKKMDIQKFQNSSFFWFSDLRPTSARPNCSCGPSIPVDSGLFRIYFCSIYWKWKIPGFWPKVHWSDKVICLGRSDRWNWKSERDGNLVRQTELTQLFFGLNPTTWHYYQPRPTNHVQSTATDQSPSMWSSVAPWKPIKVFKKRDERTKVTESRDLFVT